MFTRTPEFGRPNVRKAWQFNDSHAGGVLAFSIVMASVVCRPANRWETLIGRGLAMCVHPVAAWRCGSLRARLVVVAAYFAASYTVILSALAL